MTKLLVLFSMLYFVKPIFMDETIITSSGKMLFYENSPATFICKSPHTVWKINVKNLTECNCPKRCGDILFDKTRITAYCKGSNPILHFKQMKLDDNFHKLKCFVQGFWNYYRLLVGRRNNNFYHKEPFALVGKSYRLVCERKANQEVHLYDDNQMIGTISVDNSVENFDEENFVIIINESKITLLMKKVDLKDNGKIVGCYTMENHLSLLTLTVNVPVSSVSLHQEGNGSLTEDETATFVCKVDESKPKASFQWILFKNGLEREITETIDITSKQNGHLWQTNSTLKLKLKRSFKAIRCRARIQGMAWTNSTSFQLDIRYPPEITISHKDSQIRCSANANPAVLTYSLMQKWGSIEKRIIEGRMIFFTRLIYQDAGNWICKAVNGIIPNNGIIREKSVKVKINTVAHFKREETQQEITGNPKRIKVCFYCHPKAEVVEWHSEHGKLSSNKSTYTAAEDGQFPFIGNCSTLTLDITEKPAKIYQLIVQNKVGTSKFSVTLDIEGSCRNNGNLLVTLLSSTIAVLIIIIIIITIPCGIIWFKYRSYSMKEEFAYKIPPLPSISGAKNFHPQMMKPILMKEEFAYKIPPLPSISGAKNFHPQMMKPTLTMKKVTYKIPRVPTKSGVKNRPLPPKPILMMDKAACKIPSLPTESGEADKICCPLPTKPKSEDEPAEPIYTEIQETVDERSGYIYENLEMQRKENEDAEPIYLEMK